MVDGASRMRMLMRAVLVRGHERGSYDGGGEHRCESAPMDMAGIHKAVEGVLCKRNGTTSRFICMKKVEKAARKTLSTGKPRSL